MRKMKTQQARGQIPPLISTSSALISRDLLWDGTHWWTLGKDWTLVSQITVEEAGGLEDRWDRWTGDGKPQRRRQAVSNFRLWQCENPICNHVISHGMKPLTGYWRKLRDIKVTGLLMTRPVWVSGENKGSAAWDFLSYISSHPTRLYLGSSDHTTSPIFSAVFSPVSLPYPFLKVHSKGTWCGADGL